MPRFLIGEVELRIPDDLLSPGLESALYEGRFEHLEALALTKRLEPGDRVLDLGSGAGFTAIHAARIVGPENVVAVEANPALIPVIAENLTTNGVAGVTVVHGAVLPGRRASEVDLQLGRGFWSASLLGEGRGRIAAPGIGLETLIEIHAPSVICCDLEGWEATLFAKPLPRAPRLLVIDLHPNRYDRRTLQAMLDALSASGLTYAPVGSRGAVIVLEAVEGDD